MKVQTTKDRLDNLIHALIRTFKFGVKMLEKVLKGEDI
jgi:hypothetical protein